MVTERKFVGDRSGPAVDGVELTLNQNHTFAQATRGIRNGSDSPVDVKVRFAASGNDFIYKNIQPGATEAGEFDMIYQVGSTAVTIGVLW